MSRDTIVEGEPLHDQAVHPAVITLDTGRQGTPE
jgi:hypothetical protein